MQCAHLQQMLRTFLHKLIPNRTILHTGSANSLSFHKPGVCVCVCLLQTDSRAITSIKKRNQLMNSEAEENGKRRRKTINNVYSLLKRSDAYAYVHAIIVTVFVDIIYAYSLSHCVHESLCVCGSARERIFMGKFQPFFVFLRLRKYLHHENACVRARSVLLARIRYVYATILKYISRSSTERSNSLCQCVAAVQTNRIKYAKDDPKRKKITTHIQRWKKKYACKHWCNCYW